MTTSSMGKSTRRSAPAAASYSVGLLAADLAGWGGGRDLLRMIAAGLALTGARIDLLVPRATFASRLRSTAGDCKRALVKLAYFKHPRFVIGRNVDYSQVVETVRSSGCEFDVVEYAAWGAGLARTLEEHGIDVVLPCLQSLGRNFPGRWIGYIPDLQHKYLPQFFSRADLPQRDKHFQRLLRDARTIIVASRQVKADLEHHYETGTCDIVVLPFSPIPQPEWLTVDVESVRGRYGLTDPYFLISNQFWRHKDHTTAIKALSLIGSRDVQLICTGDTHDDRAPEYFGSLHSLVADLGLAGRVRFLGHIPKTDQMAIMRGAVAVLQPTLFEGGSGGGSVYDAVGVGTPAIVSDIAVNREIVEEGVDFFRVSSSQNLAEMMTARLDAPNLRVNNDVLLERAARRREKLAVALLQAIAVTNAHTLPWT